MKLNFIKLIVRVFAFLLIGCIFLSVFMFGSDDTFLGFRFGWYIGLGIVSFIIMMVFWIWYMFTTSVKIQAVVKDCGKKNYGKREYGYIVLELPSGKIVEYLIPRYKQIEIGNIIEFKYTDDSAEDVLKGTAFQFQGDSSEPNYLYKFKIN